MIVHYIVIGMIILKRCPVEIAVHIFSKTDKTDTHLHKQVINQTSRITVILAKRERSFTTTQLIFRSLHRKGAAGNFPWLASVPVCPSSTYSKHFQILRDMLDKVIEQITLVDDAVAVVLSLFKSSLESRM